MASPLPSAVIPPRLCCLGKQTFGSPPRGSISLVKPRKTVAEISPLLVKERAGAADGRPSTDRGSGPVKDICTNSYKISRNENWVGALWPLSGRPISPHLPPYRERIGRPARQRVASAVRAPPAVDAMAGLPSDVRSHPRLREPSRPAMARCQQASSRGASFDWLTPILRQHRDQIVRKKDPATPAHLGDQAAMSAQMIRPAELDGETADFRVGP